jgi:hypothetical protein
MQAFPWIQMVAVITLETVSDYRRDTSVVQQTTERLGMTRWVWSDRSILYEAIQNSLISLGKAPYPHLCHPGEW